MKRRRCAWPMPTCQEEGTVRREGAMLDFCPKHHELVEENRESMFVPLAKPPKRSSTLRAVADVSTGGKL